MITETVIPIADPQPQPVKIKLCRLITAGCLNLFEYVTLVIIGGLVTPLRNLCAHYYRGREGVAMPHSALGFIISSLLALAGIKSQFQSHHQAIMFSATSTLMYGLFSFAELVVSAAGLDPTSVYAIIAHLGKIASLCIFVASLASLFYI